MSPWIWILICGGVIARALFILVKTLTRAFSGECCTGCRGCAQRPHCSNPEQEQHII